MADSSDSDIGVILVNGNYPTWKIAAMGNVMSKGGLGIIDGSSKKPGDDKAAELKEWNTLNQKVCGALIKSVHTSQYTHIQDCLSDGKKMWDALATAHANQSATNRFHVMHDMFLTKQKDEEKLADFASRTNALAEQLKRLVPTDGSLDSTLR